MNMQDPTNDPRTNPPSMSKLPMVHGELQVAKFDTQCWQHQVAESRPWAASNDINTVQGISMVTPNTANEKQIEATQLGMSNAADFNKAQ